MNDPDDGKSGPDLPPEEGLQGWVPSLATPAEVRAAIEKAFEYRGNVTLALRDGRRLEGYVFDRREGGDDLSRCTLRLIPTEGEDKISVAYGDIVRLEFSGRDAAEGKSFELWSKRHREGKARAQDGTHEVQSGNL